jgi:hypothetical protein
MFWKIVAVMTALGPVTIAAVQIVTGVTHGSIRFQLIMGIRPVGPLRGEFAPGGVKVTLHALGAEIVAVGTGKRATAVKIRARFVNPGLSRNMIVAVMTALGPVAINAVQVMTGIAHGSIHFQLIMGIRPVGPVRGRHTARSTKMALIAFE